MKKIIIDEFYNFERNIGHIPVGFLSVEDEIRDVCDKNKILVQKIIKYEGYRVIGKKIRVRKTYEKFKKVLQDKEKSE